MKSETHVTSLTKVTQHPKFQLGDLSNFNAHMENVRLDNHLKYRNDPFQIENGWMATTLYMLRYCRNVCPTWVKFNSKDTKESE